VTESGVARVRTLLKEDAFGRVECLERGGELRIRRVACGGAVPFSRAIARQLLTRERRALAALRGLAGVPTLGDEPAWTECASLDGRAPDARGVLVRSFVEGEPLHRAATLPEDFFDRLRELVLALHARGVCHNDLHKEQNVIAGADGWPHLVDFQLASVHPPGSRALLARASDDLRHVEKHRRRYLRDGRGPSRDAGEPPRPRPRTWSAAVWRRIVKPLYNFATRRVLRRSDGEPRRRSTDPFPSWTAPRGPRVPSEPGPSAQRMSSR
jgi:hypothetical protein